MLRSLMGFILVLAIVGVLVIFNKPILTWAQAEMTYRQVQDTLETPAPDWSRVLSAYEGAQHQYPDNMEIANRLAWVYLKMNQPDRAEALYRDILKRQPGNMDAQVGLANVIKANPGRYNEAVDIFREAKQAHSQDPYLLSQIGSLYKTAAENPQETRPQMRQWLYDIARYYYELSLQLDKTQFTTNFNLGVAYQNLYELDPAKTSEQCELLPKDPMDPKWKDGCKLRQAARSYCRAIIIDPESYETHYNLGLVLNSMNYLNEAYRQMDRAVELLSRQASSENAASSAGEEVQMLARKVQNVKNANFRDPSKQGLMAPDDPSFLGGDYRKCLTTYKPDGDKAPASAQ